MKYTRVLKLDFNAAEKPYCIYAKQGDCASRFVQIIPLMDGEEFSAEDLTAVLRCEKPDGTVVFNSTEILDDGSIEAELTSGILACAGITQAEITLYDGDTVLSSCRFFINVNPSMDDTAVESSDEFTQLQKMMEEYSELISSSEDDDDDGDSLTAAQEVTATTSPTVTEETAEEAVATASQSVTEETAEEVEYEEVEYEDLESEEE